ncbi:MAG TPA: phage tail sheath C-terminal domain-containing protein [Rubrivivax sp.]|nr:phage tail sheath C-terminal domain-containing protein [Rubrivivax sp.]
MARANYLAPGVYVEEVASARQPIAGVGTNTVGFIGIVPSKIWIPVPNPKYDPVKAAARLQEDAAKGPVKQPVPDLETKKREIDGLIATAQDAFNKAKSEREGLPATDTEKIGAADKRIREADKALGELKSARAKLDVAPPPAPAVATDVDFEDELAAYDDRDPPVLLQKPANELPAKEWDDWLSARATSPYYFKRFQVDADEFATKLCTNFTEYTARFGEYSGFGYRDVTKSGAKIGTKFHPLHPGHHLLTHAVAGFFRNGGTRCFVARLESMDDAKLKKVLERFESIDDVAIIAAPGLPKAKAVWEQLELHCESPNIQNVFAILDSPAVVGSGELEIEELKYSDDPKTKSVLPRPSTHAAFYFPHVEVVDPAKQLQEQDPALGVEAKYRGLTHVAPSGHVAGIYARVDEERGVHKAPANAVVRGALEVKYYISKPKQEMLNPQGVNCIRIMNGSVVVWGARTIGGDRNGEWKYVSVRRLAGYLEESIDEGTQWVVFEPNDPSLWSKIRLNVSEFLTNVWRNGALFGNTPEEAFYVKCDEELNPPAVRDLGQVITEIGVAIVRPAEFVIFRISQIAGGQRT